MIPSPSTRIIVVCGPTGSGKTKFAIDLARQLNGEIVGADSMQVFRKMDIGTAKPTAAEQSVVPHHLVGVIEPDTQFDAARYVEMADQAIDQIVKRGKVPLVVGGTGLYIKSLILGIFPAPSVDLAIRRQLREKASIHGNTYLHRYLTQIDLTAANKIHPNDIQRLLRAIEFYEMTGEPISEAQQRHDFGEARYRSLKIGLHWEREHLYQRIDQRVDVMIEAGLLEEVKRLLDQGYAAELNQMKSLGYRHMVAYIHGQTSWNETVRTLKRDHRRYAKRQLTWFRADPSIHWIAASQVQTALNLAQTFFTPAGSE